MTSVRRKCLTFIFIISAVQCWHIPQIPANRRVQYYLLSPNGGYHYGYDTGSGHFAKQTADASNEVQGQYTYNDQSGNIARLQYTSGIQGFSPVLGNGPLPIQQVYQNLPPISDFAAPGDGSYSFAIDTDTYKRKESSDSQGNVKGRYSYTNQDGLHDLKYIAGADTGFVAQSGSLSIPNGLPTLGSNTKDGTGAIGASSGDASYSFSIDTPEYKRQESSDQFGNVKGHYSYTNSEGSHDLGFVAGANVGFQPIGGSLLKDSIAPTTESNENGDITTNSPGGDASYSFAFKTDIHEREETADASGNVKGRYAYTDYTGHHDLSYKAGDDTGFVVTGGNLAAPTLDIQLSEDKEVTNESKEGATDLAIGGDGSYSFSIDADEYKRQESSDSYGNVKGSYSYTNNAGTHDLSYVAGSETGFLPTGGSLAVPNGLLGLQLPPSSGGQAATVSPIDDGSDVATPKEDGTNEGDASYSFTIDTDEYKRKESSDAEGNVEGYYSYKNDAGNHDLKYIAGSKTGFLPTGGSLAVPNGLLGLNLANSQSSQGNQGAGSNENNFGRDDASYSFSVDTDEYKRKESSDAQGNVMGQYSYTNNAGTHDLEYVAGSKTGFLPTGGSLAVPNGLLGIHQAHVDNHDTQQNTGDPSSDNDSSSGDASYKFTIDTDDYKRQESSDSQGNIKGQYSYENNAGTHDLTYIAGSNTGFVATGGSLAVPNGLVLPVFDRKPDPVDKSERNDISVSPLVRKDNGILIKTFLPPDNVKFGYTYETT